MNQTLLIKLQRSRFAPRMKSFPLVLNWLLTIQPLTLFSGLRNKLFLLGLDAQVLEHTVCGVFCCWTSLVAQTVKRLSAMRETWVWSLGWEDPLEKEMAIHSSTIAWETPWTEEPGRLQSMGSQRVGHNWATSLSLFSVTKSCLALVTPWTAVYQAPLSMGYSRQ